MRKRSFKKRFSGRKKPWETLNWVPYIGNRANDDISELDTGALEIDHAGSVLRVVQFAPARMGPDGKQFGADYKDPTDTSVLVKQCQGNILVCPGLPPALETVADMQLFPSQLLWWCWQVEDTSINGVPAGAETVMVGPSNTSTLTLALREKRWLSWGVHRVFRRNMTSAGSYIGGDDNQMGWFLPKPRIPKGGLRLGAGTQLSLIVQVSYDMMERTTRNLAQDATENVYQWPLRFMPVLRFLVAG